MRECLLLLVLVLFFSFFQLNRYEEGGGDVAMLAEPERFFRDISTVKGLRLKVQAFETLRRFPTQVAALEPQLHDLQSALEEVQGSAKWKSIILYVLAIGNYINGSSNRGNAMGFRLDSLNKLRDTKTSDNQSNLLAYLATTLEKKDPAALTVAEELKDVGPGMRVSFVSISEDIQALTKAVANIEAALSQVVVDDPRLGLWEEKKIFFWVLTSFSHSDKFKEFVTPQVAAQFRAHLNKLVDGMQRAEKLYKELATSYGEDPSKMTSSEFLVGLSSVVL